MCEWWDYSRGFSIKGARHIKITKDYRKGQGPYCKAAGAFFNLWKGAQELLRRFWPTGIEGFGGLGTRLVCAGGRGDQGSSWGCSPAAET
jgi:hypothetical protein